MKVTRIDRGLLEKIVNSLPLNPDGSIMKLFELTNDIFLLDIKTEGKDLLIYEYQDLREYETGRYQKNGA